MEANSPSSLDVTRWQAADEEYLGTKPKQWLRSPAGSLWLWKESREHHDARRGTFRKGDDWSEVVAGRLGRRLGLPVAEVVLATRGERFGVVSRIVFEDDAEVLVHGNEMLAEVGVSSGRRDRAGYTVEAVALALESVGPPVASDELPTAFDWFTGYLVLDALIGNTDRHQDNWASIRGPAGRRLSPSFDHASCLGFQISDEERLERIAATNANRTVASYAASARTKFEDRPSPIVAAVRALKLSSAGAEQHWLGVVRSAPDLDAVLGDLPQERMGRPAKHFASLLYSQNLASLSDPLSTIET